MSAWTKRFLVLFVALFLVACGTDEESSDGGGEPDPGPDPDPSQPSLSLKLVEAEPVDPSDPQTISKVSDDSPGEVIATLEDSSGSALSGEVVEFSTTIGTLNPSSGTALTNDKGKARIALRAGNNPGAGTVSASVATDGDEGGSNTQATLGFETLGDSTGTDTGGSLGAEVSLRLLGNNDKAISDISAAEEGTLRATVTSSDGKPATQEVVTFNSTIANILPADGTALTNDQGIAEATLTAGSVAGAGRATAEFGDASSKVSFETAGDQGGGVSQGAELDLKLSSIDIRSDSTGILTATLTRNGEPLPNRIISITSPDIAVSLSPSSGTKLTDANGQAKFTIFPEDEFGAGSIEATADLQGEPVSQSTNFQIKQADIRLGGFIDPAASPDRGFTKGELEISLDGGDPNLAPDSSLASGGSLAVTARLVDTDGELFEPLDSPIDIKFASKCANSSDATIDTLVQASGGVATATYTDNNCDGKDRITAKADIGSKTLTATSTFDVDGAPAGSIEFIGADPQNITLEDTGGLGLAESSNVTFKVLDENGNPVPRQDVDFQLSTDVGGISRKPSSGKTNGDGKVSVRVYAGTVPTAVRVVASFDRDDGTQISTVSDQLVVSTGLPDNDSFSLSVGSNNPSDAYNTDGRKVDVTIRAADHFNNPVPDKTSIAFETEGGSIEDSCNTEGGVCSVTWTSQDPRPVRDTKKTNPNDRYGRATILATAIGEETFEDANGNGRFDVDEATGITSDETFEDLNEAFQDENEDGTRTANGNGQKPNGAPYVEEFKDFNKDKTFNTADALYNGTLCTDAAEAQGHCEKLVNVRDENIIVMPTSTILIEVRGPDSGISDYTISGEESCTPQYSGSAVNDADFELGGDAAQIESQSFDLWFYDLNCNALPEGTQISVETDRGKLKGDTDFTVGSTTEPIRGDYTIREKSVDGAASEKRGDIKIEVTNDESNTRDTESIEITVDAQ